ncbi:cytochrome P450 [Geopyxis carbonaria]|nr:cytochrome P450 [Geopyxis carbonaria]
MFHGLWIYSASIRRRPLHPRFVVVLLPLVYRLYQHLRPLTAPTAPIVSLPGQTWMTHSLSLIRHGMSLHGRYNKPFTIAAPQRYNLLVTSPALIAELTSLPPTIASFRAQADEQLRTDYQLFPGLMVAAIHIPIIRKKMTTARGAQCGPAAIAAWDTLAPRITGAWTRVDALTLISRVISEAVNTLLVGAALARDPGFHAATVEFATHLIPTASALDRTPWPFESLVALTRRAQLRAVAAIEHYLVPVFEARHSGATPRTDDGVQWLLDSVPTGTPVDARRLIRILLFIQAAAIHTTTFTLTQYLYDFAWHAHIQPQLRAAVAAGDEALLDSTFRESARLNGVDVFNMRRRMMVPYTFSDGTRVAAGTWVGVPGVGVHRLTQHYDAPDEFRADRFVESGDKYVKTSGKFLPWGHGASACPGRFFAAGLMKELAKEWIRRYDVAFGEEVKERPGNASSGISITPASVEVLFRLRDEK